MTLTQTYYLAHSARNKLSKEAARADHDLRLLVGHANLLDGLMLELADAEREQESWFDQTVKGASEEPKRVQWADTIAAEHEEAVDDEAYEEEDSDSDSDSDDEEMVQYAQTVPLRRIPKQAPTVSTTEVDEDEDMEDDEEYDEDLTLTRTSSSHPPELLHESDSDSDDDSLPSPPQSEMHLDPFSGKQASFFKSIPAEASLSESEQSTFLDEGYYLPQRQDAPLISAY